MRGKSPTCREFASLFSGSPTRLPCDPTQRSKTARNHKGGGRQVRDLPRIGVAEPLPGKLRLGLSSKLVKPDHASEWRHDGDDDDCVSPLRGCVGCAAQRPMAYAMGYRSSAAPQLNFERVTNGARIAQLRTTQRSIVSR
jgi:hypothetical protein